MYYENPETKSKLCFKKKYIFTFGYQKITKGKRKVVSLP